MLIRSEDIVDVEADRVAAVIDVDEATIDATAVVNLRDGSLRGRRVSVATGGVWDGSLAA